MKIVINRCFGGFSLSPLALKRLSELKGRPCYFFSWDRWNDDYIEIPDLIEVRETPEYFNLTAFDIQNPNELLGRKPKWTPETMDQTLAYNGLFSSHYITSRPEDRDDPDLVRVVEELGSKEASGECARLAIVEIPNNVRWEIDDHDGSEKVVEKHQSWS